MFKEEKAVDLGGAGSDTRRAEGRKGREKWWNHILIVLKEWKILDYTLSFQKFKFIFPLMNDTLSLPPSLNPSLSPSLCPSFPPFRVKSDFNQRQANLALEQTKNNTEEEEDGQNNNL